MSTFDDSQERGVKFPSAQVEEHLQSQHTFGGSARDVGLLQPKADPLGNWVVQRGYLIADIPNGFVVVDLENVRGVRMSQSALSLKENDWGISITYTGGQVHYTNDLSGETACQLCDLIRANLLVSKIPEAPCAKQS
jgi:hypothetical protein